MLKLPENLTCLANQVTIREALKPLSQEQQEAVPAAQ
jgi:hypothetical protein